MEPFEHVQRINEKNYCEFMGKGMDEHKQEILLLEEGQTTDESLNLRDELKVYAAKKKTTSAAVHLVDMFMNGISLSNKFCSVWRQNSVCPFEAASGLLSMCSVISPMTCSCNRS